MLTLGTATLLTLIFITIAIMHDEHTVSPKQNGWPTRRAIMNASLTRLLANGMLVVTGSADPISELRTAVPKLRQCVAEAFDEHVPACLQGAAGLAAASWLVLTDVRTWLWPPDLLFDDLLLDVVMRRLKPAVRRDQCSRHDRPEHARRSAEA